MLPWLCEYILRSMVIYSQYEYSFKQFVFLSADVVVNHRELSHKYRNLVIKQCTTVILLILHASLLSMLLGSSVTEWLMFLILNHLPITTIGSSPARDCEEDIQLAYENVGFLLGCPFQSKIIHGGVHNIFTSKVINRHMTSSVLVQLKIQPTLLAYFI
jgi:hypothetical protein